MEHVREQNLFQVKMIHLKKKKEMPNIKKNWAIPDADWYLIYVMYRLMLTKSCVDSQTHVNANEAEKTKEDESERLRSLHIWCQSALIRILSCHSLQIKMN